MSRSTSLVDILRRTLCGQTKEAQAAFDPSLFPSLRGVSMPTRTTVPRVGPTVGAAKELLKARAVAWRANRRPTVKIPNTTIDDVLPRVKTWGDTLGLSNDILHDWANNHQIQYESAKNTLENAATFVGKHVDPRMWGDSPSAQKLRSQVELGQDISNRNHMNRLIAIARNSKTGLDDLDTEGSIGRHNLAANAALGDFTTGSLLTGGAGLLARGASASIGAAASRAGLATGGTISKALGSAAGFISSQGPRGERFVRKLAPFAKRIGPAVGGGIEDVGSALRAPLNLLGSLSRGTKDMPTVGQGARSVAGAFRTPLRVMRHPVQAARYAVKHPIDAGARVLAPIAGGVNRILYPAAGTFMYADALDGNPASAGLTGAILSGYGAGSRLIGPTAMAFTPVAYDLLKLLRNSLQSKNRQ